MADCHGRREHLLYSITNAPIIFASIHGVYDLREELEEPIVVPPNVIVIEAADMGEVTLTSIDPLLWELIQNRELFRSIIAGEHVEARFLPTLRALHLHMPGDLLYKRKLIYEPDNIFDNRWALYKFDAAVRGIPFPRNHGTAALANAELTSARFRPISDDFLRGIKTALYRDERAVGLPLRSGLVTSGRNDNYSQIQFITDCQRQYGTDPTIYIISACADMWLNARRPSAEERARDRRLSTNQRNIDLKNYECGIETLAFQGDPVGASVSLRPSRTVEQHSLRSRTGAAKGASATGWTENFAPSAYGNSNAVTGNTSAARALLEDMEATGEPILANLNGPIVALYTSDHNPIPYGTSAHWPRKNAEKYAKGKELLTVTRDARGKPIFVPFKVECEKGICCRVIDGIKKCFEGGTRRFVKKSKKTRKIRKTKKSL
jgi:hypothetical protein